MTDQFTKPFTDLFKAGQNAQFPAQVQSFIQDGLSKTRDAALTSIAAIKGGTEQLSKVNVFAPQETAVITAKVFDR